MRNNAYVILFYMRFCQGARTLDKCPPKLQKPYAPSLLTPSPNQATATKLVTARLLRVSLTDTSSNPTTSSNIRLYNTEERSCDRSSFMPCLAPIVPIYGILLKLSTFPVAKMETKMEVFPCTFIISKKPILSNGLFVLFAEFLRMKDA